MSILQLDLFLERLYLAKRDKGLRRIAKHFHGDDDYEMVGGFLRPGIDWTFVLSIAFTFLKAPLRRLTRTLGASLL